MWATPPAVLCKAAPHGAPSLIGRPPRPRFTAITYGGGVPWIAASNDERASNHERLAFLEELPCCGVAWSVVVAAMGKKKAAKAGQGADAASVAGWRCGCVGVGGGGGVLRLGGRCGKQRGARRLGARAQLHTAVEPCTISEWDLDSLNPILPRTN